ncbi:N-acetylglucosamine kinase [Quadrisphaera setariae]|uniref:N-acetylglucosamine kinase n=1 Tax=Quadrisphaera setariae TaxID=2593304 RepID=A0A5C8ZK83_9ACTN|nr:N-acetylglucosamine kinase [Quadrisphaera setariae]
MYLGVDAGGTKTALCLVDDRGEVRGRARAGSGYYLDAAGAASRQEGAEHPGVAAVAAVLAHGLAAVCADAGASPADVTAAVVGLAAHGEVSDDVPALDAMPRAVLGHERYRVVNDVVVGWAGSLGGADGINLVAGTGSNSYGSWRGAGARCGGWGELFGDEGSGYWIALRGLQAFSHMSDGRLPRGPLHAAVRSHLGLDDGDGDFAVLDTVLVRWRGDRGRVAALSRVVGAAAASGDAVASAILGDAGRELAAHAHAVRRLVGAHDDDVVPVSTSGSVAGVPLVRAALSEALAGSGLAYELRPPLMLPEAGAAVLASRLAGPGLPGSGLPGSGLDAAAVERLAQAMPA